MNTNIKTEVLVFLTKIRKRREEIALVKKRMDRDGRWYGYVCPVHYRQTPEEVVLRRVASRMIKKIAGISFKGNRLQKYALLRFVSPERGLLKTVHVYLCRNWEGNPRKTLALEKPEWFLWEKVPYQQMKPEYALFLPRIVGAEKLKCEITLDTKGSDIIESAIEPVDHL